MKKLTNSINTNNPTIKQKTDNNNIRINKNKIVRKSFITINSFLIGINNFVKKICFYF